MTTEKMPLDELKKIKWQTICESLPAELRYRPEGAVDPLKRLRELYRIVCDYLEKAKQYLTEEEAAFLQKEFDFYIEFSKGYPPGFEAWLNSSPDYPEGSLDWYDGYLCGFVGMVRATMVHIKE